MTITAAINSAFSGLSAASTGMAVVSENVANSGTVGYTRRVLVTTEQVAGGRGIGVNVVGAQRLLDTLIQKQLRLETAGAAYTGVKATTHSALDAMFDAPGATGSLPTQMSALKSAVQTLVSDPSTYGARASVVSAASTLASSLNSLSGQVQTLRQNAETSIGMAVTKANSLLDQLASVSSKMGRDPGGATSPALLDQRDSVIDQLSELMDVSVSPQANGSVRVTTTGGLQLFDGTNPYKLTFDANTAVGPGNTYSVDPAKRTVGTIKSGAIDVLASGMIRSGTIAAYVEMRDEVLPQAQTQLDALAAGLASALSDKAVPGTPALSGGANGFDVDLASLGNGNTFTVSVTSGGTQKTLTFVKAGSAAAAAAATASGNGVVGIDFSGGMAGVACAVATALGSGFTAANPSGSVLRILDDGAAGTTDVASLGATATVTGLQSGGAALPLFVDGAKTYTGSYENGSQFTGLAGRLIVNPGIKADFSKLVDYSGSAAAGDATRPSFILDALAGSTRSFTGKAGIGGSAAPYLGSVESFASQIVVTQAAAANSATSLHEGQSVVLNAIQSRFSEASGVNIDQEMAQLIQLQTAYGANARVMTAAKQMLDSLIAALG